MGTLAQAVLEDGRELPFVLVEDPPQGGMKYTYFSPDRSYVVQFFHDPDMAGEPNMRQRLQAIIGRYNPTRVEQHGGAPGTDEKTAAYFAKRFCWPQALVEKPEFGIVCPAYGDNFRFGANASYEYDLRGVDKRSTWFTTAKKKYLASPELGDFRNMLQISLYLARSVRRMHQAGLAHSDLSNNNVLIDPKTGDCIIIDIDSLVVPGIFPPKVIGTPGYIAPEVLESMYLPWGHPERRSASVYTDLHAMAVLIYEYLLGRHPLVGRRMYAAQGKEDVEHLFGSQALFVEHPLDYTNRPGQMKHTIRDLGPILAQLFYQAFVEGLHCPEKRPLALEWERGLEKTWELLEPCNNIACMQKWFVLQHPRKAVCPFCGQQTKKKKILRLCFHTKMRGKKGLWIPGGETNVYQHMTIYPWHVFQQVYPNEKTSSDALGELFEVQGVWYLTNRAIEGMRTADGKLVPRGERIALKDKMLFRISDQDDGMLIEVAINSVTGKTNHEM